MPLALLGSTTRYAANPITGFRIDPRFAEVGQQKTQALGTTEYPAAAVQRIQVTHVPPRRKQMRTGLFQVDEAGTNSVFSGPQEQVLGVEAVMYDTLLTQRRHQ